MKTLAALLLSAFALAAQNNYVGSTGDVVLAAAATAATVQQPATNARLVTLQAGVVYCSVACTVTQSITGTAASTTAGTPVAVPGSTTAPAAATFWTASNAGSGTTIAIDHVPAGGTFTFDLSRARLGSAGTTANYTISVGSITGTANIKIFWQEQI